MTDQPKLTDAELNKSMAVNVGGWMKMHDGGPGFLAPLWCRLSQDEHGPGQEHDGPPDYCHDANLMLEVGNRLRDQGFEFFIHLYDASGEEGAGPPMFHVGLTYGDNYAVRWDVDATNLPRALCELTYEAHQNGWLEEQSND